MDVQRTAGWLILQALPPYRRRLLRHWTEGGQSLGKWEQWLFTGLSGVLDSRYYAGATSSGERERLKALCMADSSAIHWAHHYLSLGFPDQFTPALAMFGWIEEALASGRIRTVHQVACCSGREIAHFAKRYPAVDCVGSDFDPALVGFLNEHWRAVPNLRFVVLDLEAFGRGAVTMDPCDLFYASGGFHYMDSKALSGVLLNAREQAEELFLSQPMDRIYDLQMETGTTPRRQLSWNHPYPRMLEAAGWVDVAYEEGFVESLPRFKNVAVRGCRREG